MFELIDTPIKDLYVIKPKVFGDNRGFFLETYQKKDFLSLGLDYDFVQDNHSKSKKGVLRGLHYQKHYPQAKCVRVIQGEVFDVAVDLRKDSPTYGKWYGIKLSSENKLMLMIPRGFAHGFLVLSEEAEFMYKCDGYYHPEDEGGIMYNDPDINIEWPEVDVDILLSDKDKKHSLFNECHAEFDS